MLSGYLPFFVDQKVKNIVFYFYHKNIVWKMKIGVALKSWNMNCFWSKNKNMQNFLFKIKNKGDGI